TDFNITAKIEYMETIDLVRNVKELYYAGEINASVIPSYISIVCSINFVIEKASKKNKKNYLNKTWQEVLPYPLPFMKYKISQFERNAKFEFTDIGRIVRYMLTTLARYRASVGYGYPSFESPRNILNEGDVELALNIAILLEEALLFRSIDNSALEKIDSYFFNADSYMPTGERIWGSAERANYAKYKSNLLKEKLSSLFKDYLRNGVIDPADILLLYFAIGKDTIIPNDNLSFIEKKNLLNEFGGEQNDFTYLKYILPIKKENFRFTSPIYSKPMEVILKIDHEPNYLVAGKDIVIENIYPPKAWGTDVPAGRTGGIPPPRPPKLHDLRLQWDLNIKANFKIRVGIEFEDIWLEKNVEINFGMPIYVWLPFYPMSTAIKFKNLNEGTEQNATYVYFTPEAIACDRFTKNVWEKMKKHIGNAIATTYGLASIAFTNFDLFLEYHAQFIECITKKFLKMDELYIAIKNFIEKYVIDFLPEGRIGVIDLNGFKIILFYSNSTMNITVMHNYGMYIFQFNEIFTSLTLNFKEEFSTSHFRYERRISNEKIEFFGNLYGKKLRLYFDWKYKVEYETFKNIDDIDYGIATETIQENENVTNIFANIVFERNDTKTNFEILENVSKNISILYKILAFKDKKIYFSQKKIDPFVIDYIYAKKPFIYIYYLIPYVKKFVSNESIVDFYDDSVSYSIQNGKINLVIE
ncbi:MAG: hypothetical protein AB1779_06205, partial [Candidatus Thermoplasmatota archaeon]